MVEIFFIFFYLLISLSSSFFHSVILVTSLLPTPYTSPFCSLLLSSYSVTFVHVLRRFWIIDGNEFFLTAQSCGRPEFVNKKYHEAPPKCKLLAMADASIPPPNHCHCIQWPSLILGLQSFARTFCSPYFYITSLKILHLPRKIWTSFHAQWWQAETLLLHNLQLLHYRIQSCSRLFARHLRRQCWPPYYIEIIELQHFNCELSRARIYAPNVSLNFSHDVDFA